MSASTDNGVARMPALTNGRISLRALSVEDLDWLRAAETSEFLAFRWRLRGGHPNPNDFVDQLWSGLIALFVIEQAGEGEPVGILSAYQADQRNGHCRVAGARLRANASLDSSFMSGLVLFFDYLFGGWPFRKLYLESPEFCLAQFRSAVACGYLTEEARLTEFVFLDDRYWDVVFLSVTRDAWALTRSSRMAKHLIENK